MQVGYTELYPFAPDLPTRIATLTGIRPDSRIVVPLTYYDGEGTEIVRQVLEAGVAG